MRPQLEIIDVLSEHAFHYKWDTNLWPTWHFHPEIDVLLNLKHSGSYLVGDTVADLQPGTLIVNAPNVPHALQTAESDDDDPSDPAMMVLFFSRDSLRDFLDRPEFIAVRKWLDGFRSSIQIHGETRDRIEEIMRGMQSASSTQVLLAGLSILDLIARSQDTASLCSPAYAPQLRSDQAGKLDDIIQYVRAHLREEIRVADISKLVHMSEKTLGRFFRRNTGRSVVQYINEVRISEACQRLLIEDKPITEICFEVGFNNISNFNRRFKQVKEMTPREFRQRALRLETV